MRSDNAGSTGAARPHLPAWGGRAAAATAQPIHELAFTPALTSTTEATVEAGSEPVAAGTSTIVSSRKRAY